MLVAVGKVNMAKLVDGMLAMVRDEVVLHELNKEKGLGTWIHKDGWGIAYLDNGKWVVKKSTKAMHLDPMVEHIRKIKTSSVILHARFGSIGDLAIENTHPFFVNKEQEDFVFCHNGTVKDEILFDAGFIPEGKTDSERLFYSILTNHQKDKALVKAIRNTFDSFEKCKDSNIILSSKKRSLVSVNYREFPKYLQMHLGKEKEQVIISSEALISMPQLNWRGLEQGEIVEVSHQNKKVKLHKASKNI